MITTSAKKPSRNDRVYVQSIEGNSLWTTLPLVIASLRHEGVAIRFRAGMCVRDSSGKPEAQQSGARTCSE